MITDPRATKAAKDTPKKSAGILYCKIKSIMGLCIQLQK